MSTAPLTLRQCLQEAQSQGLDRLDAQMLLLHALGRDPNARSWLVAHDGDLLSDEMARNFRLYMQRRQAGEPVAYITGYKEFFGLNLIVDARVLVPRPDTETLVHWALDTLAGRSDAKAIDLGTGSGAIALALKHTLPTLEMHAVDFSEAALQVARANAQRLQIEVAFIQSNWLEQTHGPFDLIVSNPPYIEANDPHLAALSFEPPQALASGADGLADIRTITTQATHHLKSGGWLLLEHGYNQSTAVRALLSEAGFLEVHSRKDLAGLERCTGGCLA
jgi:release factor glutamine methyltransferase